MFDILLANLLLRSLFSFLFPSLNLSLSPEPDSSSSSPSLFLFCTDSRNDDNKDPNFWPNRLFPAGAAEAAVAVAPDEADTPEAALAGATVIATGLPRSRY
jgi:hypothetical protein